MAKTPDWLTDEAIEKTQELGREIAEFLLRRDELKSANPNAKVEPHHRLVELLAARKAEWEARTRPRGEDGS